MDVNKYLSKQYKSPGCWLLVVDIYVNELGLLVENYTPEKTSLKDIANAFRVELHRGVHGFIKTETPKDYSVVLMSKLDNRTPHHAGIYYQGKVLHVLNDMNYYQDLFSLSDQYKQMEFWINEN